MYQEIKNLAEEALRLQNKNAMDEAFKQIIAICDEAMKREIFQFNAEFKTLPSAEEKDLPRVTVISADVSLDDVTGTTLLKQAYVGPASEPAAAAYCDTGDDKPREPRGTKKARGAK